MKSSPASHHQGILFPSRLIFLFVPIAGKNYLICNDRRYRYPFINCTNCGPRFSIIKNIPYDRPSTTMAGFDMCDACREEYENPSDRRFHAQPIACPTCGPQVSLQTPDGTVISIGDEAIRKSRQLLKNGKIMAIKGLGGYHLACDATNTDSITALRSRKYRSEKPFALMAFDLKSVEKHCVVTKAEAALLESPACPIVILRRRDNTPVAGLASPHQNTLRIHACLYTICISCYWNRNWLSGNVGYDQWQPE